MAARIASVSGLWDDINTWGGAAVPVNGDSFTINAGVIVEFNVDQSAMAAGMQASVINGTLRFRRVPGTYILKMNQGLSGTGIIDITAGAGKLYSETGDEYPAGCVAEIRFPSNNVGITVSGQLNIRCLEPVNKAVLLSSAASSGQAVLNVDTNLTAEPNYWKPGDKVCVCNIAPGRQVEEYTILSVTSTQITLTTNLSQNKLTGAMVVLSTRNVKLTSGGVGTLHTNPQGLSVIRAEMRGWSSGLAGNNIAQCGGVFVGITATAFSVQRGQPRLDAVFVNCLTAISGTRGTALHQDALVAGCNAALSSVIGMRAFCRFYGNNAIIVGGEGNILQGCRIVGNGPIMTNTQSEAYKCDMVGNSYDFDTAEECRWIDCASDSPNFFNNATITSRRYYDGYTEILHLNHVPGAIRATMIGGEVYNALTPTYNGEPYSHRLVINFATVPGFIRRDVLVPAGATLRVSAAFRMPAVLSPLPQIWIYKRTERPALIDPFGTGTLLASSQAQAAVTDTWELVEAAVVNTTSEMVEYRVLVGGTGAGTVYVSSPRYEISTESDESIATQLQSVLDQLDRFQFTGPDGDEQVLSTNAEMLDQLEAIVDQVERLRFSGSPGSELVLSFDQQARNAILGLGSYTVDVLSPTTPNGNIEVEVGDDYTIDSGRVLPTGAAAWWEALGLETAASITFTARALGRSPLTYVLTDEDVLSPTLIQLQFTKAQTKSLGRGVAYDFEVTAVLDNAHGSDTVTLWKGKMFGV